MGFYIKALVAACRLWIQSWDGVLRFPVLLRHIPIRRAGFAYRDVAGVLARRGSVPVPLARRSVRVVSGLKLAPLGLIGHNARSFYYGEHLICRMYVRPCARAVVEEDGYDLQFLALFASNQMMHIDRAFKVFGIGRASV